MEIYIFAVGILFVFATIDLVVGVSNDAVNFLNSSVGSRVAPRRIILIVASLGILAGVTFSSGMMEIARKGIFHPGFFTMPDLMIIFLAVMITDVLLLDLFNTFGLPTSTTVSIVFELLGAAVAISLANLLQSDQSLLLIAEYINTGKALAIISGILLSVVIAFFFGALAQFATRLLFTYHFETRLRRWGGSVGWISSFPDRLLYSDQGSYRSFIFNAGNSILDKNPYLDNHLWMFYFLYPVLSAVTDFYPH
jgi:phosphate/sulfate permease